MEEKSKCLSVLDSQLQVESGDAAGKRDDFNQMNEIDQSAPKHVSQYLEAVLARIGEDVDVEQGG